MLLLALIVGIVAGLRALMAPAFIAWAARGHGLWLEGSWLAILGWKFTPWVFTIAALAELVTDQLPSTPSRKVPPQFIVRMLMGALCGGAIGIGSGSAMFGLILGAIGALIGTYGGSALRSKLSTFFGKDRPAAIIEDVIAIVLGAVVLVLL